MKYLRKALNQVFPTWGLKNSPTVRYAFSFMFLFAAIAGMALVSGTKGSYIKIISSEAGVEVGKQFTLDVYVYADVPVNAVDISVAYPQSQIEVLGIDKGESVVTLWAEEPYVADGAVILRGGTYKRGFVGEHKIATISVKAKTAGNAQFVAGNVSLLAGDGKGTSVSTDTSRAKILTKIFEVGQKPVTTLEGNVGFIVVTDVDGDGTVSLRDISSFMANWTTKTQLYDFNNDGEMNFKDFSIILADYFLK